MAKNRPRELEVQTLNAMSQARDSNSVSWSLANISWLLATELPRENSRLGSKQKRQSKKFKNWKTFDYLLLESTADWPTADWRVCLRTDCRRTDCSWTDDCSTSCWGWCASSTCDSSAWVASSAPGGWRCRSRRRWRSDPGCRSADRVKARRRMADRSRERVAAEVIGPCWLEPTYGRRSFAVCHRRTSPVSSVSSRSSSWRMSAN